MGAEGGGEGGKGTWKPHFNKGWGKGKGKNNGLKRFDAECRVWVGGLAEGTTWKELEEHMDTSGKSKWIEVFSGKGAGTGAAAYATAEEAAAAIAALNGSKLKDSTIQCDSWEKKPEEEKK